MEYKESEESFKEDLKWHTVEGIPNFPISNFDKIKTKINSKEFSLSLNPITTLEFSSKFSSGFSGLAFSFFLFTTWIVAIASVILAFVFGNFWLLLGIVLGYVAHFASLPYVKIKKICYLIAVLFFIGFLYGVLQHEEVVTLLSLSFILPVLANIFLYDMSYRKLRDVSLNSERLFIYLFQTGKLMLQDNKNNSFFSVYDTKGVGVDQNVLSELSEE